MPKLFSLQPGIATQAMGLKLQPVGQFLPDWLPLWCIQLAELANQFDGWHGMDLLQMKSAFSQKRLGTKVLPSTASEGRRVRKHCDQRQLLIKGITGQQQTRARLCSQAQVHHPHVTPFWTSHPSPPSRQVVERPNPPLESPIRVLRALLLSRLLRGLSRAALP